MDCLCEGFTCTNPAPHSMLESKCHEVGQCRHEGRKSAWRRTCTGMRGTHLPREQVLKHRTAIGSRFVAIAVIGGTGERRGRFRESRHPRHGAAASPPPRPGDSSSGQLVEKHIEGGNPTVPGNDEISPGVSRRLPRAARYPSDPSGVARFLGLSNWLISKLRVSSLDGARDAIDLVAATNGALAGILEHAIFGPELVDGRSPARGIVFTEDVAKISDQ